MLNVKEKEILERSSLQLTHIVERVGSSLDGITRSVHQLKIKFECADFNPPNADTLKVRKKDVKVKTVKRNLIKKLSPKIKKKSLIKNLFKKNRSESSKKPKFIEKADMVNTKLTPNKSTPIKKLNLTTENRINKVKKIVNAFEENLKVKKCQIGPDTVENDDSEGAKLAIRSAFDVLMERGGTPERTPGMKSNSYEKRKSGKMTTAGKNMRLDKWLKEL